MFIGNEIGLRKTSSVNRKGGSLAIWLFHTQILPYEHSKKRPYIYNASNKDGKA